MTRVSERLSHPRFLSDESESRNNVTLIERQEELPNASVTINRKTRLVYVVRDKFRILKYQIYVSSLI